jgi:hypothetical protein
MQLLAVLHVIGAGNFFLALFRGRDEAPRVRYKKGVSASLLHGIAKKGDTFFVPGHETPGGAARRTGLVEKGEP